MMKLGPGIIMTVMKELGTITTGTIEKCELNGVTTPMSGEDASAEGNGVRLALGADIITIMATGTATSASGSISIRTGKPARGA